MKTANFTTLMQIFVFHILFLTMVGFMKIYYEYDYDFVTHFYPSILFLLMKKTCASSCLTFNSGFQRRLK